MRLSAVLIAIALTGAAITRSAAQLAADGSSPADASLREVALQNLLTERTSLKDLEKAAIAARQSGVSEQAILEARFLFHVDQNDDAAIAAMLPDFMKRRDHFKPADSAIFAHTDDWLAAVEYVQAVSALRKNDINAFKKHITEAFWLSPGQAAAFAPQVERTRLDQAMRSVKIDFTIRATPLSGTGDAPALSKLINGKKALLLHFWSPWSSECEASLGDFAATTALLAKHDIAVLSLVPDKPATLRADTLEMIRPHLEKPFGTWGLDDSETPLAQTLLVRNLPAMILIGTDGRVLFNGAPDDARLWNALAEISPAIHRPASSADGDE